MSSGTEKNVRSDIRPEEPIRDKISELQSMRREVVEQFKGLTIDIEPILRSEYDLEGEISDADDVPNQDSVIFNVLEAERVSLRELLNAISKVRMRIQL